MAPLPFDQFVRDFSHSKVLIFGLGLLGSSLGDALLFSELGCPLRITDLRSADDLAPSLHKLRHIRADYILGEHRLEDVEWADTILRSAAVPWHHPLLEHARKQGKQVVMDTQRNRSSDFPERPVFRYEGFVLTGEKSQFSGNLTREGYPLYAGSFELRSSFLLEKQENLIYRLAIPSIDAQVAIIELNGQVIDTLVWSPWETEITGALRKGKNDIKITLVSSLRNLLGPHHHPGGELIRVGPGSFGGAGGFPDPSGDRFWYDLRINSPVLKLWRDDYHFIPFGIPESPVISGTVNN